MDINFVIPTSPKPAPDPNEPKTEMGKTLKKFLETPIELPDGPVSSRGLGDLRSPEEKAADQPKLAPATAPKLDVEVPDPDKIVEATAAETQIMAMDATDPRLLLAQEFSRLPGIGISRSAEMAMGVDGALHNLNVGAKRQMDLARRKMLQAMNDGKGNTGRRKPGKKSKRRGRG